MQNHLSRRGFLGGVIAAGGALSIPGWVLADPPRKELKEPVYRVSKAKVEADSTAAEHPLDPVLEIARDRLKYLQEEVVDYSCVMVKRERIGGKLGDREYMFAKVRNRKKEGDRVVTPFSIYMYFLKPSEFKGRECLYVENENKGKMIAHEAPNSLLFKTVGSVWIDPNGPIAMKGQRYPITDAGLEALVEKLLERGGRDRARGPCQVDITEDGPAINGRKCRLIEVKHAERNPKYDFHVAQIFIDKELDLPVRYAAFDWPNPGEESGEIIEEYTYVDLKLNVGLTDLDFDPKNSEYLFERRKK